tara:strand:- start:4696 stop:5583 length:888 start_codon:yes stop_codon:yes gene_type:complete
MKHKYSIQEGAGTLYYYDSAFDLDKSEMPHKPNKKLWEQYLMQSRNRGKKWWGCENSEEVQSYFNGAGWEDGFQKGTDSIGQIEPIKLPSMKRKSRRGPVGSRLDIHQVYAGRIHEAWSVMKREGSFSNNMKKVPVTIVVDLIAGGGESSDEMFWGGAVASMLADSIAESGRPVKVIGAFKVSNLESRPKLEFKDHAYTAFVFKIKDFQEPVDVLKLFTVTALGGFFRYYGFKAMFDMPFTVKKTLGHCRSVTTEDLESVTGSENGVVLHISNVKSQNGAIKMLENFRKQMSGEV